MSADLAVIAGALVLFALVSKRIGPTIISAPMIFVAVGLVCGPQLTDAVDLGVGSRGVEVVGEAALAILLFSDAMRIDTRSLRKDASLPARLLGIGLPLTVAFGTLIVYLLVPDVGWATAALIAAILSPTDAALGQEVVTDPSVPARIRQGLNVESGLNDGMIVPAVALFLTLSGDEGEARSAGFWARFVADQIGIGVLTGIVVGGLGAWLLVRADRQGWLDGVYAQIATLAVGILAFTASTALDGNGFIAAFVAGLAYGTVDRDAEARGEYTEDTAQLAAAVAFFLFGNVLVGPALGDLDLAVALCAISMLTIGRMLPVAIALLGSGAAKVTVGFLGWFGPRGLASMLFGILILEEELAGSDALFAVVAWTVLFSVVLHGATAAWGAKRYGAWFTSMADDHDDMPESAPVAEQRVRRPLGG